MRHRATLGAEAEGRTLPDRSWLPGHRRWPRGHVCRLPTSGQPSYDGVLVAARVTVPTGVTVHGDCPDFRGGVRENGTVPLDAQGDRHIFRPKTGRKMSQSPPCERLPTGAEPGYPIRAGADQVIQVPACFRVLWRAALAAVAGLAVLCGASVLAESWNPQAAGVAGGLMVVIGQQGTDSALAAVQTGPFLAQVLLGEEAAVTVLRDALHRRGVYGLVSVDRFGGDGKLPYAENLVNLVAITEGELAKRFLGECVRVLCPYGALVVPAGSISEADLQAAGLSLAGQIGIAQRWQVARKPWPAGMDSWTHPRHGPDGNAVSRDILAGPPRRVRWVAGPAQEVSNLVVSEGRNFYAGVLARDGFNGLRLWERPVKPSPARGGFSFRIEPRSVHPVAMGQRLLVVDQDRLLALDGATGQVVAEYPQAGTPREVLAVDDAILALGEHEVRAVDAKTAALRWRLEAVEPRYPAAAEGALYCIQGKRTKGAACEAVAVNLADGAVRWRRSFPWLPAVRGLVAQGPWLVFEISTLNDDKPGNLIHVVSAADGSPRWNHTFVPGMAHMKQARALLTAGLLWILDEKRCVGLDPVTGQAQRAHPAGWGHCFPPIATPRFLFAGEMELTDLATGQVDANRITKGACSRDAGFVVANGLVYTAPKHCTCWPMLRDYSALATERPGGSAMPHRAEPRHFVLETSSPQVPGAAPESPGPGGLGPPEPDWPCYRHDAWRSGSTSADLPARLKRRWEVAVSAWPEGTVARDWRQNAFARGPVTPPVCAGGTVYVAATDAHQIVALDLATGSKRWAFTANGRIDTPPTVYRGVCLFGTRTGHVYALDARDGRLRWRLRAAPVDERIVAYGQLESPWPVPGSVLVTQDTAFFAAGRQPLADGGILVFAADPATGQIRWVQRLDSVPQTNFYGGAGLEFKAFDLLQREGQSVVMSRWLFDLETGRMTCDWQSGFGHVATGGFGVMVPRGFWSYGPRYESEQVSERPFVEPLVVFRDDTLLGCSQDRKTVYRRDFRLGAGEQFDRQWYAKWTILNEARKHGGDLWRSQRLARGATWSRDAAEWLPRPAKVAAMVLTPRALLLAGSSGGLAAVSPADGKLLGRWDCPPPVWDGLAAVPGHVLLTTQDGRVLCFGPER